MGSATYAYSVDIDELQKYIGSKNALIVEKIEASLVSDPLAHPNEPSVHDGLKALVFGPLFTEHPGISQQLYAFERLCGHVGQRLASECIAYLDDLGWETELIESGPPLGLPHARDFPDVSYLNANAVKNEYTRFANMDTDCDNPEIEEAREEFVGWLQQCRQSNASLITFQY